MAVSYVPGSLVSSLPKQRYSSEFPFINRCCAIPASTVKACPGEAHLTEEASFRRRPALVGMGAAAASVLSGTFAFAEEVPKDYKVFVDRVDGYTYYYPADWRDFDFLGHDSAFKDRTLSLQNVRVSFKPTDKTDIRDLGPMNEVVFDLVKNIYAAPNQTPTIFDIKERTIDGKHYWTFEYDLATPTFARSSFSTIAIGNGRIYTLIVGANERRWSRMRNKLRVVADSFKMLDI